MRFQLAITVSLALAVACSSGSGDSGSTVTRELPPRPESPFTPWSGDDLLLYDVLDGTELNLGPGRVIGFSPRGNSRNVGPYFAWLVTDPMLREVAIGVMHVETGETFFIDSPARFAVWSSDRLLSFSDGVQSTRVDLELRDSPSQRSDAPASAFARLLDECSFDRDEWTIVIFDPGGAALQLTTNEHQFVGLTPDGRLTLSQAGLGADAIVDLETLEYEAVLPDGLFDIVWSADFRYAAVGTAAGHGGRCM